MRSLYIVFFICSVIVFNQSCDQSEICQDDLMEYANLGFYKIIYGVEHDTAFENIFIKGLQLPDTIPFDTLTDRNYVLLPLPQGTDSCKFVFSFAVYDSIDVNDTLRVWDISHYIDDTLQLIFSRQMYLVSADCGFSHSYIMKSVNHTMNLIQSVDIVNDEITGLNEENIKIYF